MTDKQHPEWMGKNRKLTPAEVKEFLAEPVVARIATIDESGVPYVTPVWQEWDGQAFWIDRASARPGLATSRKPQTSAFRRGRQRDLQADYRAGESRNRLRPGSDARSVPRRRQPHGGAFSRGREHGPEYLVPTYDRPRYLIKIAPTKMLTWEGVEWAKKYTGK